MKALLFTIIMARMENGKFQKAQKQCKYSHNTGLGSKQCYKIAVDAPRKWIVLGI